MQKRSDILDVVRGAAITMVVAFHCFPRFHVGATGVDLFFVLSGYLIGGILLGNRGSISYFRAFYGRRMFRIVPLYVLLLAVAYMAPPLPVAGPDLPLPWYAGFVQNFGWLNAGDEPVNLLAPTWSLAVEEQFYLVLPAIIWLLPRRWLLWSLWALVIISPFTRLAIYSATHLDFAPAAMLPGRLDSLMGGVLVAIWARNPRLSWLGLACIAPAIDLWLMHRGYGFKGSGDSVTALLYAGLLGWIVRLPPFPIRILQPLRIAGIGAYSAYLLHVPILALCNMNVWMALPIVCAISWLSWITVERPLIGWARERFSYHWPAPVKSMEPLLVTAPPPPPPPPAAA